MPAVMEQVERISVSDKMRLMEYLVKSISVTIVRCDDTHPRTTKLRMH